MNLLNNFLTGALLVGFLAGVVFMIIYSVRWDWWLDEHGAHLGSFTAALTLIMGLYVFRPFIDPIIFAYIRAPLFLAIVVCMVWRLILLLKSKESHRSGPQRSSPGPVTFSEDDNE
jgi:hypothetical protein